MRDEIEQEVFAMLYAYHQLDRQRKSVALAGAYEVAEAWKDFQEALPKNHEERRLAIDELWDALKGVSNRAEANKHRQTKEAFIARILERRKIFLKWLQGRL